MTIKNFSIVFASLLVLSLVLYGCSGQGEKPQAAKSATEMEQWGKDLLAAWTSHDVEKVLSFYEDDAVLEDVAIGRVMRGKEEIRAFIKESYTGFPDYKIEMKSFFASEAHICMEWISSGTHKGDLPGMPATGKNFSVPGVAVIELTQRKAKREVDYWDSASMMRQLGLLPSTIAADPFFGTWKLNGAKSKASDPSAMPKSEISKWEGIENGGMKSNVDGVDAEGKAYQLELSAKFDGKDYPLKGYPLADTLALIKTDATTLEMVAKKAGKEVEKWLITISKDGKTQTWTGTGKNAKGQVFNGTFVYEKQ